MAAQVAGWTLAAHGQRLPAGHRTDALRPDAGQYLPLPQRVQDLAPAGQRVREGGQGVLVR